MKKNLLLTCFFLLTFVVLHGQYCTTGLYTNGCSYDDDINDFSIGSYSQTGTSCTSGTVGYSDYTTDTITLSKVVTYNYSVSTEYSSNEYIGFYIDANDDGDFNDADEFLGGSGSTSFGSGTPYNGTLLIPNTISTGLHRFRARLIYNTPVSAGNACASYSYGEVHDYIMDVQPAPPCPPPYNLSVVSVSPSSANISYVSLSGTVNIKYGLTGFNVSTGGTTMSSVTANPATVPGLLANTTYDVYIQDDCSSSGNGSSAWSGPISFTTACNAIVAPYIQDFDGPSWVALPAYSNGPGDTLDNCWKRNIPSGAGYGWVVGNGPTPNSYGTGPNGDHTSGSGNYMHVENPNYSYSYDTASLYTPFIGLNSLTSPELSFYYHMYGSGLDSLRVDILSNGVWYNNVLKIGPLQTSNSDPWALAFLDLSSYADTIQVRFRHINPGTCCYGDASIDDISFDNAPACRQPILPKLATRTDTSVTITFGNAVPGFDVEWGPVGFSQGTGCFGTIMNDTLFASNSILSGTCNSQLGSDACYDFYIRSNCSGSGNGTSVWVGPYTFCTGCSPVTTFPYVEDWDFNGMNCWTVNDVNNDGYEWELDTTGYYSQSGNNVAGIYYAYPGSNDLLISNKITLTGNERMRFWSRINYTYDPEDLSVLISTTGTNPSDFTDTVYTTTVDDDAYSKNQFLLDNYSGDVYIAFHADSTGINYGTVYVDDITIEPIPPCLEPDSLQLIGKSYNSASVSWSIGGDSVYNVDYGPMGHIAGTGTIDSVYGLNHMMTGLSSNTLYDVYVQTNCTADSSIWIGPVTFRTSCLPTSMPYTETYDSWPLTCWDTTGGDFFWAFDNTGTGDNYAQAYTYNQGSAYLTSPIISLTSDAMVKLSWGHLYASYYSYDALTLRASIVGSSTWDTIFSVTGSDYNSPGANYNSPGTFVDEKHILDPTVYTGQDVAFQIIANSSAYANYGFINDFKVENAPTCPPPTGLSVSGITDSSAMFSWSGGAGTYQVWYGPQGFYQGTATYGGTQVIVNSNSFTVDTLNDNTCYEYVVRAICSAGDTSDWDWEGAVSFCTPCSPFMATYIEDFDLLSTGLSGDLGNCWHTLTDNVSNYTYGFRTNSGATSSYGTGPTGDATSGNGIYLYTEASNGIQGDSAALISPMVNVSNLSSPQLRFSYHMYGADIDTLHVDANDGSGWQNDLLTIGGQQQTADTDPWKDTLVDLSSLGNYVQVRFRVYRGASYEGDVSIDDIYFDDPITCFAPTNLGDSAVTDSSAMLTYSSGGSGTFQISYGHAIQSPQAGTMVTTTNNSGYTLNGLTSATEYCFYVREICSVGDTSYWSGPYCFSTLCQAVFTAPYYKDFNYWPINCWDNTGGTNQWMEYSDYADTSAMANFWNISSGTVVMSSPQVILPTDSRIRFAWSHAFNSSYPDDSLYVRVKKVSTGVYDTLLVFGGSSFNDPTAGSTNPGNYIQDTIMLDPAVYTGSTIVVQFWGVSGYGPNLYIDDFHIEPVATACSAPTNVSVTPVACDSIMVNWSSSEDSTYLALAPSGSMPTSAILVQNDTMAYMTGTMANTSYDLYMATICGGDTSALVGPISFNSGNAGAPTTSFTYNVNGYDVSFDASGSMGNGNSYSWDFGDGSSGVGDTISHTYASGGSQQVKLTITNACGTTDTTFTVAGISLEEIALGAKVSIFPNPSHDVANVDVNLDQKGTITIELLSLNGKLISSRTYGSSHQVKDQLNLSHLPNGVYMIRIKTDNGNINRKLIKE